jgi:hypothetical protein
LVNRSVWSGDQKIRNIKIRRIVWGMIWFGLIAPELIFIVKWVLLNKASEWGIGVPDYLRLWPGSAPHYVAKIDYVSFCLPVLAIALGQIKVNIYADRFICRENIFYIFAVASVLFVFREWQILNGSIYALICVVILMGACAYKSLKLRSLNKHLIVIMLFFILAGGLSNQIIKHLHFHSFAADARVALQAEGLECCSDFAKSKDELGSEVNLSNYKRVTWFINGLELIWRYPLGYGLLQSSFGHLIKIDYPSSKADQSHSGWIDLTLAIGVPGVCLILGALLLAMRNLTRLSNCQAYPSLGLWALSALSLCWFTTELSQRVYIDVLLFWIALSTGIAIGMNSRVSSSVALDFIGRGKRILKLP